MGDEDERARREAVELAAETARAQPIADAILKAADAHEAARAEATEFLEPFIRAGQTHIAAGEYEKAALVFEGVADEYRARHLRGDADQWDHRAADCRSAARHAKRRKKGSRR
jgi:hypothetical protein